MKIQNKKLTSVIIVSIIIVFALLLFLFIWNQKEPEQELLNTYLQLTEEDNELEAKEILEKILKHYPNNSIALNNMAIDLIQEEQFYEAQKYLQRAQVFAGRYSTSDTITAIALFNMNEELVLFRILRPGHNTSRIADHIEYNIEQLTTTSSY